MKRLRTNNLNSLEYWEKRFNDTNASLFKKMAFHPRKELLIKTIVNALDESELILDLGSGLGAVLRQCLKIKKGLHFIGSDFSPAGVKYIQTELKIPSIVLDITEKLPFPDKSFDILICTETLEHLEDPMFVFNELKRVARKKVIISVPYDENVTDRIISTEHLWSFSETDFGGEVTKVNPFMVCIIKI